MAAVLLVAALAPGAAEAQTGLFFDEFGVSSRTAAMGSALTGIADDSSAAYYNPAGIGFAPNETYGGFRYVKPRLELDFLDPNEPDLFFDVASTRGFTLGTTGYVFTDELLEMFEWMEAFRWGAALFLSYPEINTFTAYADETQPYFFRYDARPDVLNIAFAFAYRGTEWLSIGGGFLATVNTLQETDATIRILDVIGITEVEGGDPTGGLDLAIGVATAVELTPTAGIALRIPVEGMAGPISLGFSYRGEIGNVFGAGATTTTLGAFDDDGVFIPFPFDTSGLDATVGNFVGFAPEQYSGGIGLEPTPGLLVGADFTYKVWEEFTNFFKFEPDPPFENTIAVRLGAEYVLETGIQSEILALRSVAFRGGYGFEPTANPSLDGRSNLLDSDQHVLSGGLGFDTRFMDAAMIRVDLLLQVHVLESREATNEGDPRHGPYQIEGKIWNTGFEVRVDW